MWPCGDGSLRADSRRMLRVCLGPPECWTTALLAGGLATRDTTRGGQGNGTQYISDHAWPLGTTGTPAARNARSDAQLE